MHSCTIYGISKHSSLFRQATPKMPKRSSRLPLLAVLVLALALVCVAAILIWLNTNFGKSTEGPQQQDKHNGKLLDSNETVKADLVRSTEATRQTVTPTGIPSNDATVVESEGPAFEASSSAWPLGEVSSWRQSQHAPQCPEPSSSGEGEPSECKGPQTHGSESWPEGTGPEERLRPFEYILNISLGPAQTVAVDIGLTVLAELLQETALLALHCGRHLGAIGDSEVRIWHCQSGSFLCIRSLTRLLDSELLLLELANPLPAGALLRLQFARLRVPLSSPALLVQIPSPWERDRAWLVGTQLPLAGGARHLFPVVDSPRARAVFRLCLSHPPDVMARANAPALAANSEPDSRDQQLPTSTTTTCFHETPALAPTQFAFLLFRGLRPVLSVGHSRTELFIGGHLRPEDYGWALEESDAVMGQMIQLTGMEHPTERLTLVSSPLAAGNDAVGGLGLAQIRDSWMEYPKFVHTHNLLVGQVVRQWTASMLSLCEECLQQGLGLFFEWMLAAEFGPAEDKGAEFGRRVAEARQRLLGMGPAVRPVSAEQQCAERAALVLNMLDWAFGRPTTAEFLGRLFRRHAWDAQCTTAAELSQLFSEATQGVADAQQVFDSFLLHPSNGQAQPPLIQLRVQPQASLLLVSHKAVRNQSQPFAWVPVEFVDDTGKNTRMVLNGTEMAIPLVVSAFLLAQPHSFARFVYNVENYQRLSECFGGAQKSTKCPSVNAAALKDTLNDLCWALLNQQLEAAESEAPVWRQLFHSLSARGAVQGDCGCCMQPEADALKSHCRWTWLDKCSRIQLLANTITSLN